MSIPRRLRIFAAAALLAGVCGMPATAQEKPPSTDQRQPSEEELKQREDWRIAIAQAPAARKGCFEAKFPSREWKEVACVPGPNYPMPPKSPGPRPLVVGNGDDIMAQAPSGFISTAIGSFESLTNVTSISGPIANSGPSVANAYTLQVNTNDFASSQCATASVPGNCTGWEQFVFENNNVSHRAYIQYWLKRFGTANCPAGQGWTQIVLYGENYCYKNNTGGTVNTTAQPVGNLGTLSLSGSATATSDWVTVSDGTTAWTRVGDNAVAASAGWSVAEFNIFGDGGNSASGGMVTFNAGADLNTRTRIFYGGTAAPFCATGGFTAETNSLSFGPTTPAATAPGPAVIFKQSTAGTTPASCALAATIGDTHLHTFGGLFYDFQATGDFLLAQRDEAMVVQTRQVSGAPTWPDASVNSAVAAQFGKSKIAVCLGGGINVDGDNTQIPDGKALTTADGTDIWHTGNVYTIIGPEGDSVRATINSSYIDVAVGLGKWPANVKGLLANVNGDVNQLAARDGTVITNPFSFETLYGRYGGSWRVASKESLLNACGEAREKASPTRPFFITDLAKEKIDRAREVCATAGVKGDTLMDACALDVNVIGDDAAKVYVNMEQPKAEARPTFTEQGSEGAWWKKWWWIILILIIILIWLLSRKK